MGPRNMDERHRAKETARIRNSTVTCSWGKVIKEKKFIFQIAYTSGAATLLSLALMN